MRLWSALHRGSRNSSLCYRQHLRERYKLHQKEQGWLVHPLALLWMLDQEASRRPLPLLQRLSKAPRRVERTGQVLLLAPLRWLVQSPLQLLRLHGAEQARPAGADRT